MRHCFVVRVFTISGSGGNALGVIPDATDLDAGDMQRIAHELGYSETVFIDWPAGGVPGLRIFTPATELPFAGHPLVGTAWVLNHMGPGVDRMSIQIGEVGVRLSRDMVWVAPPAIELPVREAGVDEADPLGITASRAWRVEVPSDYLVLEVASEADLNDAAPDLTAVASSADGVYLVTGDDPVRSRFFAPRMGVAEDPATGSAAVGLSAVRRALGTQSGTLRILQGLPEALSEIRVVWDGSAVELGGAVVRDEVRLLDD